MLTDNTDFFADSTSTPQSPLKSIEAGAVQLLHGHTALAVRGRQLEVQAASSANQYHEVVQKKNNITLKLSDTLL